MEENYIASSDGSYHHYTLPIRDMHRIVYGTSVPNSDATPEPPAPLEQMRIGGTLVDRANIYDPSLLQQMREFAEARLTDPTTPETPAPDPVQFTPRWESLRQPRRDPDRIITRGRAGYVTLEEVGDFKEAKREYKSFLDLTTFTNTKDV